MTGKVVATHACTSATHRNDYLPEHLARIAAGDRPAFRCLYERLAMRVWREASRSLPDAVDSQAVTRSTFVEVWHLAGHHLDDSGLAADAWIAALTIHRVDERLRSADAPSLVRADYDRHTYREFAAMIGAGDARSGEAVS